MYTARGFNISVYHGDNYFDINHLREHIRPASLNICAQGSHIPIIKRSIQTIKQGARYTTHYVRYKRYTNPMTISLVECIIHSRNYFPQKGIIRKRLRENKILLEKPNPDFNMNRIFFVYYAMVYTGTKNKISLRIIPGIALR